MTDDIFKRFEKLSTPVVSDVMRAAGIPHQVLHSSVKPLARGGTMAGPAYCVDGEIVLGNVPKQSGPNPRFEMFRQVSAGDIVVIASRGYHDAVVFGGNIVNSFRHKGCRGMVTDGGIRDRRDMEKSGVPVFCSFASPLSSGGQWLMTGLQRPLQLAGQSSAHVTVCPGDIVVADDDGCVIVPAHAALSILEDSETLAEIEATVDAGLNAGRDPGEVFTSVNRFKHIRNVTLSGN